MENSKKHLEILNEIEQLKQVNRELLYRESEWISAKEALEFRLEEANDTLEAIRMGEIDALIVKNGDEHQLYTLKNADQTYRIFIEQMTQGALTLNQSGIIIYCNSQFASLIGLDLEKVIGRPLLRFVIPDDVQLFQQLIDSAWEDIYTKGEIRLHVRGNDSNIPVWLSLKTLDLDEGLCLSVILTDLSSQKATQKLLHEKNVALEAAQQVARKLNQNLEITVKQRTQELENSIAEKTRIAEALRSSQKQLSQILETMAEGVGIIDNQGRMTYANPMAQKLLGLEINETLEGVFYRQKWQNLNLDGAVIADFEHPLFQAMINGTTIYDYEIGIEQSAGDIAYVSINAVPIVNERGTITGGIGTFMDVTQRRKVMQQKDDFISVASHELKTPITSLKAALQLLDRTKNNSGERSVKLIEQANKSMGKVSVLIEDLLNASKFTEGQLHIEPCQVSLNEILADACQQISIQDKGVIHIEENTPVEVLADAIRIEQVIVNFLNNALKYAPDSKQILIRITKTDTHAKISVIDQGAGIDPEKLPHIFDRYFRADSSGYQYSGLGLGLFISAEIIREHHGEIGAESTIGEGSAFWFTLPLA